MDLGQAELKRSLMLAMFGTRHPEKLARVLAVNKSTVRCYLDLMTGVFMIRNCSRSSKNSASAWPRPRKFMCATVACSRPCWVFPVSAISSHIRKVGASYMGYAVEEILKELCPADANFGAMHNSAEIDLVFFRRGQRMVIECKRIDAPTLAPTERIALADLKLDELHMVYPGEKGYPLAKIIEVVLLAELVNVR